MKLFKKSDTVTVNAIVTDAAPPPQGLPGRHYGDWVWVVADLGSGPCHLRSVVQLPHDRWLVPGMQVTITVRTDRLDHVSAFEVDFDAIAPIEDRVAANDAILADPQAARRSAWEAAHRASVPAGAPSGLLSQLSGPLPFVGQDHMSSFTPRPLLDSSGWSAAFDQALADAASSPSRPGYRRGVVILVAMRIDMRFTGHNLDGTPAGGAGDLGGPQHSMTGNQTVLAVNQPGRSPYAVFEKHFKSPRNKPLYMNPRLYPWMPALVRDDDPRSVEILWDELPSELEQDAHIAEAGIAATVERAREVRAEYQAQADAAATDAATATSDPLSPPAPASFPERAPFEPSSVPAPLRGLLGRATRRAEKSGSHVPAELQGVVDQMMGVAAEQVRAANEMTQPTSDQEPATITGPLSAEAQQAMIETAHKMAPKIAQLPRPMQTMQMQQIKAQLETMPAETRDACLDIYRAAGLAL